MGCYLGIFFFPLVCIIAGYNLSQIYYIYIAYLPIWAWTTLGHHCSASHSGIFPSLNQSFFPSNHLFSSFLLSSHSPSFYFLPSFLLSLFELQYKKYHKVDDLWWIIIFFIVLRALEVPRSASQQPQCGSCWGPTSWHLLTVSSGGGRGREVLQASLLRASIPSLQALASWLNHLQKAPPPHDAIALGARVQVPEFFIL